MFLYGEFRMLPNYFKPCYVPVIVGSIVVVGKLTRCVLIHSVYDFKVAQMNAKVVQLGNFCFTSSNLGHNTTGAIRNIAIGKDDHSTVTRLLYSYQYRLGCKNLNDQTRSERSKTVDSEVESYEQIQWLTLRGYQVIPAFYCPIRIVNE